MTLTEHGIETNDPLVGAMFLGKDIYTNKEGLKDRLIEVCTNGRFVLMTEKPIRRFETPKLTIQYPLIADAIKPVEGKPCFLIHEHAETGLLQCTMFMVYIEEYKPELEEEGYVFVAANPLTTVTPVELRELIARVNA